MITEALAPVVIDRPEETLRRRCDFKEALYYYYCYHRHYYYYYYYYYYE
jgi:hypothetical protein